KNKLYPVFVALTVALGGFLLGFDGVVNGGAVPFYRVTFGISNAPFLIGLSSSAIILGGLFGNFIVGFLIDKIGRKPALLLTSILFMVGAAGTALSPNIVLFIVSKLIAGLGVGVAILVAPMYIAEIAPPKHRGWLVTFNQLNIVVGLSVAMLSNYFILKTVLDPDINWRWMLGIGFFPALLYFILLFLIPESPRWLIQKGREEEGLRILRKSCGEEEAEKEYKNIKLALTESEKQKEAPTQKLFSKQLKFIFFIGFGLAIFQQLSGINAVLYYAPMIFESAGSKMDTAFLMAIVVGLVFTAATILSMFMIDRLGRRPLLIIGTIIMASSFLLVSFSFHKGTYAIKQEGINRVCEQAYRAEISKQAKIKYPNNYLADSTVVGQNKASLYKNVALVGSIDLQSPVLLRSKSEIEVLRKTLIQIEGKIFDKETQFFSSIKSQLTSQFSIEEQESVLKNFSEIYKPSILKESININSVMVLIGILGFIAGFSISLGPVMWAMFSEIFPIRLRAKAIAVVGAANGLTSFIVATIFPMELEFIGSAATYLLFGIFMILCLFFVVRYIPETKGKTLEELEAELIRN
ncbi:sugar porter family MFS transporter, partial [Xanthovirga aplysinae]|uniref:sugar porter family MFS transporter n=1 Tax=Xanthovirga aplysinae TaxID=2529853 RepID=UPI0012BC8930